MIFIRHIRALAVAMIAVVLLAGCGSDDASDDQPDEADVDVQEVLQAASDRLAETDTMRFNLEVDGDTWVDSAMSIRLLSAQGNLARPNMVDVEFQVELLGSQNVSIRMITVGEESWTTNLLTGNWESSPEEFGYNPAVLFDNQQGLGPVTGRLNDPTLTGSEKVGGRDTWAITGTVDNATIGPLTSGSIQGDVVTISLWIDKSDDNILQIRIEEPTVEGKGNAATWLMTLTGHNAEVQIEPPDLSE